MDNQVESVDPVRFERDAPAGGGASMRCPRPAADSGAHNEAPGWAGPPARRGMASVNTVVTPSEISSNSRFSAAC